MSRTLGVLVTLASVSLLAACATTESATQLAEREDGLICREVLRPASNQHQRVCMSASAWETYDRNEAINAQNQVERIQGGAYGAGL